MATGKGEEGIAMLPKRQERGKKKRKGKEMNGKGGEGRK